MSLDVLIKSLQELASEPLEHVAARGGQVAAVIAAVHAWADSRALELGAYRTADGVVQSVSEPVYYFTPGVSGNLYRFKDARGFTPEMFKSCYHDKSRAAAAYVADKAL